MLNILEMFTEKEPVWSTAGLFEAMQTSRSTGYRYIKILHEAGLLASLRNGYYTLGPRIIEMDLQIRQTDPLLLASKGVLEDLVANAGHSALLLTGFRDSVLCIGECRAPRSPVNRFSRGQRRTLFQGAGSKVILAHLPHHRLRTIYRRDHEEIENSGLGTTWSEFRSILGQIKKDGYLLTKGEFNPNVYGVAAPILTKHNTALGSVGLAWEVKERPIRATRHAILAVTRAAKLMSERVMAIQLTDMVSAPGLMHSAYGKPAVGTMPKALSVADDRVPGIN